MALEGNFALLTAAESVEASRLRYQAARAQFYPQITPRYVRGEEEHVLALDARQRLPWTGGSVTATSTLRSRPDDPVPATRTADLDLTLTQPLLRGAGPNATFFDLRNSRRQRVSQERALELGAPAGGGRRGARVLPGAAAAPAALGGAPEPRAQRGPAAALRRRASRSGLVSKLDVFRAQLQAAQTSETMVRSEAALQDALEQFRALLGRCPQRAPGARVDAPVGGRDGPAGAARGPGRARARAAARPARDARPGGRRPPQRLARPPGPPAAARPQPRRQPAPARAPASAPPGARATRA